jgi:hypothetical protein
MALRVEASSGSRRRPRRAAKGAQMTALVTTLGLLAAVGLVTMPTACWARQQAVVRADSKMVKV